MTRIHAAVGALAVLLALAFGELVAGLVPAVVSPLDAVGQRVVVAAPGGLATWAIDTFGAANRAVVALGTVVVALAIGAGLGVSARRSLGPPVAAIAGVGVVALLALLAGPGTPFPLALLTSVAMVAVAATVLVVLTERLRAGVPAEAAEAAVPDPRDPPVARRAVLRTVAGLAVAGTVTLVAGRYALGGRFAPVDASTMALPAPARALPAADPAADLATRIDGLTPALTPRDELFRIDTALTVPRVDVTSWRLRIHGRVDRELELTFDDLLALPLEEHDVTIACVSNEVGGDLVGTPRWLGVPLADVLAGAGVRDDAEQVVGRSVDGWTGGFGVDHLDDALVVVGMDGAALPPRHGFPVRLVVPGLYGYVSATKWLAEVELTSWDGYDAYWVPRGWAKHGPIKPASRIDVPDDGAQLDAGEVAVAGVAWAPPGGITGVEVQVDDGPWEPAELSAGTSPRAWVQWVARPRLGPGGHTLRVRALDAEGTPQPEGPAPPAPDGAEGWHTVRVEVG